MKQLTRALFGGFIASALSIGAADGSPLTVTLVGSLQSELGCSSDWDPGCALTSLTYDAADDVWQGTFSIPAGNWEYKVALDGGWAENYGANATLNGSKISLSLAADTLVKFYYSDLTHWVTSDANAIIAVAPGSFQSEMGCPGDWDPSCLRSWLQDPDADGIYVFETILPAGSYETKAALYESWTVNYGLGGTLNGANIPFVVPTGSAGTRFSFNSATNVLTVQDLTPTNEAAEPSVLLLAIGGALGLWARRRH